ncbi:MAG: hypothetical protein SGPRY_009587, partial [Prymnesium sp.]
TRPDGTPITTLKRLATAKVASEVAVVLMITPFALEQLEPAARDLVYFGMRQHFVTKLLKLVRSIRFEGVWA